MAFWTYMLRCADGSYYVGHTDDLDQRFAQHQDGTFPGYTHTRRPVELVWSEWFSDRDTAFANERKLKGWSRPKKEALIAGDWDLVRQLARRGGGRVLRDADGPSTSSVPPAPQDERLPCDPAHPEEGLSEVEGPSRRTPTRAEWPTADVIIGNPPFLGNKKMIRELTEDYTLALRKAWPEVPGGVDLVCYWFAKAWAMIVSGRAKRAGFVATQSIRRGTNRKVLQPAVDHGRIFNAWSDEEWTVDGADVRVSLICFDAKRGSEALLDGQPVQEIGADLKLRLTDSQAAVLAANKRVAGQGTISGGPFELEPSIAREMLRAPLNPNGESNSSVLRPWRNGDDLTDRPADWWIIDFQSRESTDATLFERPFSYLEKAWTAVQDSRRSQGEKPLRHGEPKTAARWWILQRRRNSLLSGLSGQSRYLATPRVSKHRFFVWLSPQIIPDTRLVAFRREDDTFAGILHSRIHELWSLRLGGKHGVGNDPEYVHTATFETFPFPEGLTPDIPAADYAADPRAQKIAAAAARLNELRENWLNPSDLVVREPEVVPGYPDRILPKDEEAAKELKKRTLTNLYNARPQWLANAHAELDEAVAEAYGWGDDWRAGLLTDDEILGRLFKLNQERSQ